MGKLCRIMQDQSSACTQVLKLCACAGRFSKNRVCEFIHAHMHVECTQKDYIETISTLHVWPTEVRHQTIYRYGSQTPRNSSAYEICILYI